MSDETKSQGPTNYTWIVSYSCVICEEHTKPGGWESDYYQGQLPCPSAV